MSQAIFKNFKKEPLRFLVAAAFASAMTLALTACGGGSLQNPGNDGNNSGNGDWDFGDVEEGSDDAFRPSISHDFTVTGDGGTNPTYTTPSISGADSTLNVKVTPGPAGILSIPELYSGASATYQCISYKVSLLMGSAVITKNTKPLNVSTGTPQNFFFVYYGANYYSTPTYSNYSPCAGAVASDVVPFSSHLYAGHPTVRIRISNAKTDYHCRILTQKYAANPYGNVNLGAHMGTYCNGPYAYYRNHTATGNLEIQVNGSTL